ncbi:MAG: hypothetical protein ACM3O6_13585 [Acidobacteriota bacterium]
MAQFDSHFDHVWQPFADIVSSAPLWSRFLHRIVGAPRGFSESSLKDGGRVFRIDRNADEFWTVTRPGAAMAHGFADLGAAIAFIRHESGDTPATVELRVDGVYAVAYLRPGDPHSLFGEAA